MESSAAGLPPKLDEESTSRETRQPSDMWAVLPEQLRSVTVATEFVSERDRWNTNEEVASLLVAFDKHRQWLQTEVLIRPPSGTLLFYSKQNQRYRKDGYFWKKRRDGKTTREDHMKLKVSGVECIYGCYVHSAILPTFHRRSYWLLQNPDIVLVHYLNLPLSDETPLPPLTIQPHKQQWEEVQLLAQLRPMFTKSGQDSSNSVSEETIQSIASTLLDNQRRVECPGGSSCKTRTSPAQTVTYLSQKASLSTPDMRLQQGEHRMMQPSVLINSARSTGSKAPLILNLSQLHGGNSLIILSSAGRASRPMTIISQKPNATSSQPTEVLHNTSHKSHANVVQPSQFVRTSSSHHITQSAGRDTNSVSQQAGRLSTQPQVMTQIHGANNTPQIPAAQHVTPVTMTTKPPDFINSMSNGIHSADVPHLGPAVTCTNVARHPPPMQKPLVSASDSVISQNLYGTEVNRTTHGLAVNGGYHHHSNTAAISSTEALNQVKPHVISSLPIEDHMTLSGCYGNSVPTGAGGTSTCYNSHAAAAVAQPSVTHMGLYGNQTTSNDQSGTQFDGHMTPHAIAQVAESDMVVDSLIREMNLQQQQGNSAMQISPTHSDLNLDDLDLSFLDSMPSPSAASAATYSSPALTMVTTPSPMNEKTKQLNSGILEFCPEWAYKDGGEKVLLIGQWYSDKSSYAVLFDGVAVPAELLQGGVLKCICPEHKPGRVKVEVASDGHVISNSVLFEYRSRVSSSTDSKEDSDWFSVKDLQLQTWLLHRLQLLEKSIDPEASTSLSAAIITAPQRELAENLELRLIQCVQRLSEKPWSLDSARLPTATRGLSLLHLAAALGYASLINCLIGWRRENQTSVLMVEVDAVSTDEHQATPLVWACALGRQEAASVLYQYNAESLRLCTTHNQSAIDLAKQYGYSALAAKLSALDKVQLKTTLPPGPLLLGKEVGRGKKDDGPAPRDQGREARSSEECHLFKVPPASPLHSTPKPSQVSMDSLSVKIPKPHHDLHTAPPKSRRSELLKRISVEVLPDYPTTSRQDLPSGDAHQVRARSLTLEERKDSYPLGHVTWGTDAMKLEPLGIHQVRAKSLTLDQASSDPQFSAAIWGGSEITRNDPMLSMNSRDLNSPVMFMSVDAQSAGLTLQDLHQHTAMETETSCHTSSSSSQADDLFDSASQEPSGEGNQGNNQMATLANQIIAAMPERIKLSPSRSEEHPPDEFITRRDRSSSYGSFSSCSSSAEPPCAEDSGISTPLEGIAEDYRYVDLATSTSSGSPASSLHSPYMDHFSLDSPPPTAEEFNEYFNAPQTYLEKDFSQLTLSDTEQRNLYAAAKIIQSFYRRYKDRKEQQMLQRQRELEAVVLIQSYYRRYKQYRYYKKMTQAAVLIQSQFRSYYAQKRYRQRREAATLIQNRYRAYKEQKRYRKRKDAAVLIQQRFRNHYHRKYQKNQKGGQHDSASDSSQKALVSESREATPSSSAHSKTEARRAVSISSGPR